MRPEMQVKQYVAVVRGRHGRFMVFETADSRYYLFSQLDPAGCATALQVPVRKADLQPDVRRALRHGCGHAEDHESFSAGPK
jgi:hypothetical protein